MLQVGGECHTLEQATNSKVAHNRADWLHDLGSMEGLQRFMAGENVSIGP